MRKRMDNWNILFIVLIFIGSVGGVLFSIKQIYNAQDDKKDIINNLKSNAVELKERNEDLNNQLDNLKIANENLSAELKSLSTKNQTLSDKLSKTSLELNKSIMGDGYSLFGLTGTKGKNYYYSNLKSFSEYNIYDISMIITDIDKLRNCKTKQISDELLIDHDCFWKNTSEDQFISIPSGSNKFSKYTLTTNDKRKHLEIKITSRSTRTVQQSVFELSENTCLQSLRLYQFDGKKWNLIKEINGLNVDNEYWKEHFYSLENRKIVNL